MQNLDTYVSKKVSFKKGLIFKTEHTGTIVFAEIGEASKELLFTILIDKSNEIAHRFENEVAFV